MISATLLNSRLWKIIAGFPACAGLGEGSRSRWDCELTNDKTAIEDKFHVGGTRGLSTRGGDMLTDVGGWYNDLTLADIVVFDENDFQEITNVGIVIDNIADFADQMNDCLC